MANNLAKLLAAGGIAGAMLVPPSALADGHITSVLQTELEGMEGTEANIVLFDVDGGWQTDHHSHPGHVFVYVLEGTVAIDLDGQGTQTYSAGEAFYEVPGQAMVGRNASADEPARFIVFQVGPTGEPIMVSEPQ